LSLQPPQRAADVLGIFHSKKADVEPHKKTRKEEQPLAVRPNQQLRGLQHSRAIAKKALPVTCSSFSLITPKPGKDMFLSDRMQTVMRL